LNPINNEIILDNEHFGVSMFDTPKLASADSFRVLVSRDDDNFSFIVIGLVLKERNNIEKNIQILSSSSNIGVKSYNSISSEEFNSINKKYNLIAIGEVL
jgi:hypothetical protein